MRENALNKQEDVTDECYEEEDTEKVVDQLTKNVFELNENDPNSKSTTIAFLQQVYHHSIHDRFEKARDLLLMTKIADNIMSNDFYI